MDVERGMLARIDRKLPARLGDDEAGAASYIVAVPRPPRFESGLRRTGLGRRLSPRRTPGANKNDLQSVAGLRTPCEVRPESRWVSGRNASSRSTRTDLRTGTHSVPSTISVGSPGQDTSAHSSCRYLISADAVRYATAAKAIPKAGAQFLADGHLRSNPAKAPFRKTTALTHNALPKNASKLMSSPTIRSFPVSRSCRCFESLGESTREHHPGST